MRLRLAGAIACCSCMMAPPASASDVASSPGDDPIGAILAQAAAPAAAAVQAFAASLTTPMAIPAAFEAAAKPLQLSPRYDIWPVPVRRQTDLARMAAGDNDGWSLFAAVDGKALGWSGGGAQGVALEQSESLVSDAQAGVSWRKGPTQTTFGYMRRELKGRHMIFGQETRDDDLVALSLSLRKR